MPADWDEQVARLGGGILQSEAWARFQAVGLKRPVLWRSDDNWVWSAAVRKSRGGFKYLLASYGPVARDAAAMKSALTSLQEVAREQRADFVRCEPVGDFDDEVIHAAGGRPAGEVNPKHTHALDLTQTEEELKRGLESGHRNRINGAERRGITIERIEHFGGDEAAGNPEGSDLDDFLRMMADTARHSGITAYSDDYYRTLWRVLGAADTKAAELYYARVDKGARIASAIVFDWQDTRYYAYAAADQEQNRRVGASVVLVWRTIMDAKAAGRTKYDFWGVAPPTAGTEHAWAGISAFKRGFGGHDLTIGYHGTWDFVVRPLVYRVYRVAKKVMP